MVCAAHGSISPPPCPHHPTVIASTATQPVVLDVADSLWWHLTNHWRLTWPESKGEGSMVTVQWPPGLGPLWSGTSAYSAFASAGRKFLRSRGSYLKSPLKQLDLDGNRAAATAKTREKLEKGRDIGGRPIPGPAEKPAFCSQSRCDYIMVTRVTLCSW